jgi:hypothetical protein
VNSVILAPNCMRALISDYRAYIIGSDGRIQKSMELDCADDAEAIEKAKQFVDGQDIELWQRERRVARFEHKLKTQSSERRHSRN